MSSSPQLAPCIELTQPNPRGGPRTRAGKATSSKNAITNGLFAAQDFIRPGEESLYASLDESLREDLAPAGLLENNLVDEIRRAMWRLRRCGHIEETFVTSEPATADSAPIPDPMQNETTARLQLSVDRARTQSHRLLHKCTAELRKLQTERVYRNESLPAGTNIASFGICDWQSIHKQLQQGLTTHARRQQKTARADLDASLNAPLPDGSPAAGSFCNSDKLALQTARNADCPCKSGLKYKRCCGRNAPPMLGVVGNAA